MDALEQKMKEKLLEGLIEHMEGKMGDHLESKFPKKVTEVSIDAPLDGMDDKPMAAHAPMDDESDEDSLMALLGDEDDDDKEA